MMVSHLEIRKSTHLATFLIGAKRHYDTLGGTLGPRLALDIKKKNRRFRKAVAAMRLARTCLIEDNGPIDDTSFQHFLSVGEYELALLNLERAAALQDLAISKRCEDWLHRAGLLLGRYNESRKGIWDGDTGCPSPDDVDWTQFTYREHGDD